MSAGSQPWITPDCLTASNAIVEIAPTANPTTILLKRSGYFVRLYSVIAIRIRIDGIYIMGI